MAQDGALVLAFDGEVDAFAEARAVDCRFAHAEQMGSAMDQLEWYIKSK